MSKTIFIDASCVIALINERDQHHQAAVKWSSRTEKDFFLTTDAVLLEVGNGLARTHRLEAASIIAEFIGRDNSDVVPLSPTLFHKALAVYRQHMDKEWGLIDCLSFEVMRRAGIVDALTFDRHFQQAGFNVLPFTDP